MEILGFSGSLPGGNQQLSRNTVSKWLWAPVAEAPKYRREARPNKLSAFEATLTLALTGDTRLPKHERRTARALHAEIKAAGYGGSYSAVTDFVRAWRQGEGQAVNVTAFLQLNFGLREAFKFGWSKEGLVVGGIYCRMQVSHLKLCASRAFWLVAYPSQGHEMLFDNPHNIVRGVGRRDSTQHLRQHAHCGIYQSLTNLFFKNWSAFFTPKNDEITIII